MKKRFVIIEDNHPHNGEICEITVSNEQTIPVYTIFGKSKLKVNLINCPHGVTSCFVGKAGLMEVL